MHQLKGIMVYGCIVSEFISLNLILLIEEFKKQSSQVDFTYGKIYI